MKLTPQTGDTQVICMEKPSGFIQWAIDLAASALNQHARQDDPDTSKFPIRPRRRAA